MPKPRDIEYYGLDPLTYLSKALPPAGMLLGTAMVLMADNKWLYGGIIVVFFGVNVAIAKGQERLSYKAAIRILEPIRLIHNCSVVILIPQIFEPDPPVWLLLITHVFGCSLLIKEAVPRALSIFCISAASSISVYLSGTPWPRAFVPAIIILASGALIQSFVYFLRTHIAKQFDAIAKSQERLSDLYNHSMDLRASIHPETAAILDCNRTFFEAVGYTEKEPIIGTRVLDLFGSSESNKATAWFDELRQNSFIIDEQVTLIPKGRKAIATRLSASGVTDDEGNIAYYDTVLTDITDKVASEKALATRTMLLANMSHEIRTPLNAIIGVTDLLFDSVTEAKNKKLLKTIQSSGESLLTIINDVLDFSKIESGKLEMDYSPTNVAQLVDDIGELFMGMARTNGSEIVTSVPPGLPTWLLVPTSRVRQILSNFISNAVKYSDEKPIQVNVESEQVGPAYRLTFRVIDEGVGISGSQQEKLFQTFSQLNIEDSTKLGGTGLGLAISKQLVDLMGGTIGVESEVGRGSTFFFTLVAKPCEAPSEKQNVDVSNLPTNLSILVVDDVENNLLVATGHLSRLGYTADTAINGRDALSKMETRKYDLVFMDCHMPVMNGFETAREIIKAYKEPPRIIGLTASAMAEDREKCFEAGMSSYITKPLQTKALVAALSDSIPESHVEPSIQLGQKINLTQLEEELGDDRDLIYTLFNIFKESHANSLASIKSAYENKDSEALEFASHGLRGNLLNLYAFGAAEAAQQVEQSARDGDLKSVSELIRSLDGEVNQVVAEIDHLMKS